MASTRQPIPDGPRAVCWKAFRDFLVTHPTLSSYGLTWDVWDGGQPPALVPPTLNPGDPPYVRLTPMGLLPNGWEAAGLHRIDFVVRVDITVPGADASGAMNVWDAIESALWPGDFTGWDAMVSLCAQYNTGTNPWNSGNNLITSVQSVQATIEPSAGPVTNATGAFNLMIFKNTI